MNFLPFNHFISPYTGRVRCDRDHVLLGNEYGVAVPSLALSDLRAEFNTISKGKLLTGDNDNKRIEVAQISLDNIPDFGVAQITGIDLPAGKILRGTGDGKNEVSNALSEAIADILAINAKLVAGNFLMGDAISQYTWPGAQFIVNLTDGMLKKSGKLLQYAEPNVDYIPGLHLENGMVKVIDNILMKADSGYDYFGLTNQRGEENEYLVSVRNETKILRQTQILLGADNNLSNVGSIQMTGTLVSQSYIDATMIKLHDNIDATKYFTLKTSPDLLTQINYILPVTEGTSGQVLMDIGAGGIGERKLGFKTLDSKYIIATADEHLPNAQALKDLGVTIGTTRITKVNSEGVLSLAVGGTDPDTHDYVRPSDLNNEKEERETQDTILTGEIEAVTDELEAQLAILTGYSTTLALADFLVSVGWTTTYSEYLFQSKYKPLLTEHAYDDTDEQRLGGGNIFFDAKKNGVNSPLWRPGLRLISYDSSWAFGDDLYPVSIGLFGLNNKFPNELHPLHIGFVWQSHMENNSESDNHMAPKNFGLYRVGRQVDGFGPGFNMFEIKLFEYVQDTKIFTYYRDVYFDAQLRLPNGTTDTRPADPLTGMIRFNTTTLKLEIYNGSIWSSSETSSNNAKYILQQPDTDLINSQALSVLSTGLLKNTTSTGVLSIAQPNVDYPTISSVTTAQTTADTALIIANTYQGTINEVEVTGPLTGGTVTSGKVTIGLSSLPINLIAGFPSPVDGNKYLSGEGWKTISVAPTTITLTGSITGSGITPINTTLSSSHNLTSPFLTFNLPRNQGGSLVWPYVRYRINYDLDPEAADENPFFIQYIDADDQGILSEPNPNYRSWSWNYYLGKKTTWTSGSHGGLLELKYQHPQLSQGVTYISFNAVPSEGTTKTNISVWKNISMLSSSIISMVAAPTEGAHLTNKTYVDASMNTAITTAVNTPITLTGSITGSGTTTIATTLAASHTLTNINLDFTYPSNVAGSYKSVPHGSGVASYNDLVRSVSDNDGSWSAWKTTYQLSKYNSSISSQNIGTYSLVYRINSSYLTGNILTDIKFVDYTYNGNLGEGSITLYQDLILNGSPTQSNQAVTLSYLNSQIKGISQRGDTNSYPLGITVAAYFTGQSNSESPIGDSNAINDRYGYLNGSGTTGAGQASTKYSIRCAYRVRATEFNAWSSIKGKNIIERGSNVIVEATELFKEIQLVKYEYKDQDEGWGENYGLIAEELNKVLPQFVDMEDKDYIPNIMQAAKAELLKKKNVEDHSNLDEVLLTFKEPLPKFESKQLLIKLSSLRVEALILEKSSNTLTISVDRGQFPTEDYPELVKVIGTWETRPTVAKSKCFELAMCVLQGVLQKIDNIEKILYNKN